MLSTTLNFLINNLPVIISAGFLLLSIITNVVQMIKYIKQKNIQNALDQIPEIIRQVEELYTLPINPVIPVNKSIQKKATAESMCQQWFGSIYSNNKKLFNDAIEDILNTPQKKGGKIDVSKEN